MNFFDRLQSDFSHVQYALPSTDARDGAWALLLFQGWLVRRTLRVTTVVFGHPRGFQVIL